MSLLHSWSLLSKEYASTVRRAVQSGSVGLKDRLTIELHGNENFDLLFICPYISLPDSATQMPRLGMTFLGLLVPGSPEGLFCVASLPLLAGEKTDDIVKII